MVEVRDFAYPKTYTDLSGIGKRKEQREGSHM